MGRLGFFYKKPHSLPAQAEETKQTAFIAKYGALMMGLGADEMVVFSDAVHPEYQTPGLWLVPQHSKNRH